MNAIRNFTVNARMWSKLGAATVTEPYQVSLKISMEAVERYSNTHPSKVPDVERFFIRLMNSVAGTTWPKSEVEHGVARCLIGRLLDEYHEMVNKYGLEMDGLNVMVIDKYGVGFST